jgi:hypothetical protein
MKGHYKLKVKPAMKHKELEEYGGMEVTLRALSPSAANDVTFS